MSGHTYGSRGAFQLGRFLTPAPGEESEEEADVSRQAPERVATPPPDPPPQRPVPSSIPQTGTDPTQPTQPAIVKEWEAIFHIDGRKGLQQAFYAFAKAELGDASRQEKWRTSNSSASWNYLLRDEKEGTNHVLSLLHTLPDFMILTLLRGELAYRIEKDTTVAKYVRDHMSLANWPGIYLNILHDHGGRWLSSQRMSKVLDILDQYVDGDGSGIPTAMQIQIDQRISPWKRVENRLRWLTSDRASTILKDWIQNARETYCSNVADLTEPFISCPTEVGWATDVKDRCKAHLRNTGTTYTFGLLHAVLRQPPPSGPGFPPPLQVLLFPVWKRDESLCRVAEIVGALLCHSYWYLGGLNPFFAGGFRWEADVTTGIQKVIPPASTQSVWANSARIFWSRREFDKPIIEEIQKRRDWSDVIYDATRIEELTAELEAVRKDKREKWGQVNAVNKEIDELKAEHKQLQDKLDTGLNVSSTQRDREVEECLEQMSLVQEKLDDFVATNQQRLKRYIDFRKD